MRALVTAAASGPFLCWRRRLGAAAGAGCGRRGVGCGGSCADAYRRLPGPQSGIKRERDRCTLPALLDARPARSRRAREHTRARLGGGGCARQAGGAAPQAGARSQPETSPSPGRRWPPPLADAAALARQQGREWHIAPAGRLSSALGAFKALHGLRQLHAPLRAALLSPPPALLPEYAACAAPALAPEVGFTPAFVAHLEASFNAPQRGAIAWAAHLASRPPPVAAPQPLRGGLAGGEAKEWPFTLVQGPPGTGKTHTVWGILNVLHLAAFQRYYRQLLACVAPACGAAVQQEAAFIAARLERQQEEDAQLRALSAEHPGDKEAHCNALAARGRDGDADGARSGSAPSDDGEGAAALSRALADATGGGLARTLGQLAHKPRILVCAPSNAATDVLMQRVMDAGFVQARQAQRFHRALQLWHAEL